jgi:SAM-dependent methyltransferase
MTANAAQAQAWNGADGRHFVAENARHQRMLAPHTARLLQAAGIGPADSVLDIGCGCGDTTIRAARAAARGRALGVDLSAVMLAEARRLAASEGIGNVGFEQADAQTRSFPAAGFDVALSRFGVMFFDDPPAAFASIGAALRPGGRLAFTCWQEPGRIEYLTVPFAAVASHVMLPALPGPGEPGPFSLADPQQTRVLLEGAGFRGVSVEGLTVPAWIGRDVDDAIGYYRSTPFAQPLLAAADASAAELITQALRDALGPYQDDRGVTLGSAAWLVTASR